MKDRVRLDYVMKKIKLTHNNQNFFTSDEVQRRMIRAGAVKSLASGLRAGNHFNSPFVVNKSGGSLKLIDGNHRWEAIKSVFETNDEFEIEVFYAEYKNLSIDEERDVFGLWNIGTKQSANDFLKIYWDTIPKGKEMLSRIPATIYNSKHKINVKTIVGNHISSKRGSKFSGGYSAGAVKVVKDFKDITSDDISIMSAYMKDMEQIFGQYNNQTIFWKTTPQAAFYRVWYDNRHIPPVTMIKAFKKVFLGADRLTFETLGKSGGTEAAKAFYAFAMKRLQEVRGIGRHEFLSDEE